MNKEKSNYHKSVMLDEVLTFLVKNEKGVYVDLTCGGGGHSYSLLKKYPEIKIIENDWDLNAIKECKKRLKEFENRIFFTNCSISRPDIILKRAKEEKVDGFLADFGTSQHQIFENDGFSFLHDSYLDMRMSKTFHKITAAEILKKSTEKQLAEIFFYYGEEINSKKIAKIIVEEREKREIKTTMHLASIIEKIIQRKKIHPATKIFQALRIAVNDEINQIKILLNNIMKHLKIGGRIVCISFNSLEDRAVKDFFKKNKKELIDVGNGIVLPKNEEILENRSSRSAKMRIFERKIDNPVNFS
jgi:16S rRNA (cytosine1402-N4)-methyltransferase